MLIPTLFFAFGGDQYLSVAGARELLVGWRSYFVEEPMIAGAAISIFYFVIMLMPLPVTAIATVSSGYLFGFWMGLSIISATSLSAAIVLFLLSRHANISLIKTNSSRITNKINTEIRDAGLWYALSIRISAVVPFFILNCVQGLTSLKMRDFILSTFFGMIPISVVLVNAGSQLAHVESIEDVLNTKVMLSLFFVALVPLIIRTIIAFATAGNQSAS